MEAVAEKVAAKPRKPKVVIIGGGISGALLAKSIQNHASVTLIDPKDYFEIPWANLRASVDLAFAERSVFSHFEYLTKAKVIITTATNVTEREVCTAEGHRVEYDYLVVATGHAPKSPSLRKDRIQQFRQANAKIKNSKNILVIGGGPSGVELASEIAQDYPDKKITLVHNGPRLLEFIGHKAGNAAFDWLKSKKVEVLLDQYIDLDDLSGDINVYTTSAGVTVAADSYFVCLDKSIGSSWLRKSIIKDKISVNGRLKVDEYFRVEGHKNIFAIGDITDIPELKQGINAQRHAKLVAKNLRMLVKGAKDCALLKYKPSSATAMVTLGRKNAVAQVPLLTISGSLPGMIRSKNLFVDKTRKMMGVESPKSPWNLRIVPLNS